MRAVVQRVTSARVTVAGQLVGAIESGLLVFVGVASDDGPADIEYTSVKIRELRVFADAHGKMNRSVVEAGGRVLLVSQFTLMGDVRKGRRPSFDQAAAPEPARRLFDALVARLRSDGLHVDTGEFQAQMEVALVNDGPVTVLLDSRRLF